MNKLATQAWTTFIYNPYSYSAMVYTRNPEALTVSEKHSALSYQKQYLWMPPGGKIIIIIILHTCYIF